MLDSNFSIEELIIDTILGEEALNKFRLGKLGTVLDQAVAEIMELSQYYTGEIRRKFEHSAAQAKAYALYYLPINFAKITALLTKLPPSFAAQQLQILDFGCGPGTGALAALQSLSNIGTLTLYDRSESMRLVAKSILTARGINANTTKFITDQENVYTSKYDLIILGNVLNEVTSDKLEFISKLNCSLNTNGIIIILEPALQYLTRQLMELRNRVISQTDLRPIYPCTHSAECPMLSNKEDWCHNELRWEIPRLVSEIDDRTGFNKHRVKYATLILQRGADSAGGSRIVSAPKKNKVGISFLGCEENGLKQVLIPKRELTPRLRKLALWDSFYDSVT